MIQSVHRAAQVLLALQRDRRLGINELAARLDLAPSTVHGIVRTLVAHGLVWQDESMGRYQLGPTTLMLGNSFLDTLDIRSRAARWTEQLSQGTGLAVRTGVLVGHQVLIVQHDPRPGEPRHVPEIGLAIPAHASAMGKVLLAFDPERQAAVLAGQLAIMTADTVVDPDLLRRELAEAARTGMAEERDEAVIGESGVAAAVFDASGHPAGAIGLVVASVDWPPGRRAVDALRLAAQVVSRDLGAQAWPAPPARPAG